MEVAGMTCTNCALTISKTLTKHGLRNVDVDFISGKVSFTDDSSASPDQIKGWIESVGYKVLSESSKRELHTHHNKQLRTLLVSGIFTLPLLLGMFFNDTFLVNPWLQLVLVLPVMVIGWIHFGKSAYKSIIHGSPNMDVLIALGSTSSFIYSLGLMFMNTKHGHTFFETGATIISLVLLGNYIEHVSVKKTTSALQKLVSLQVKKVKRLINESVEEINSSDVRKGDVLVANTGDQVPADGIIISGNCLIDESMITGESFPVDKGEGMRVTGSTILQSGNIKIKSEVNGNEGTLSNIISMMERAQKNKPDIQKLGDRVSAIFVPVVIGISLLTLFVSWLFLGLDFGGANGSLMRAVAVLVISCPCAMGLATPTAVAVGIGKAARKGILVKGGNTLEKLATIKKIIFDKTGTLTNGEFKISDFKCYGIEESVAIGIILELERKSSHPIARSLVKSFEKINHSDSIIKSTSELKGIGMTAKDDMGQTYSLTGIRKDGFPQHDLYLVKDGVLLSGIDLQDEIRVGSKETIAYFNEKEIETVLLSGDKTSKVESISNTLKIKKYFAERKPIEKLEIIQKTGLNSSLAMVGDGINDGPSLVRADVGISLSESTDIAIQSADVVVLGKDLSLIIHAHRIGLQTLQTIKQNLFWAFLYNVIAIPIAASGYLSPMIAAMSMAFSDVVVIGNSLRLKIRK